MKANISRVQLDVDYRCPNCLLHFRLSGSNVPQKDTVQIECPSCVQKIDLPPIFKVKHVNKKIKVVEKDPVVKRAISALKSQGYTLKESKGLVNSYYCKHISLEELVRSSILNDKQIKT
tara:strand:- start:2418 stop:2774 length:357 start_codon:yes stop_codon:yes gene_type:complete